MNVVPPILPGMNRFFCLLAVLALAAARSVEVRAESETIDLKALAKKARPAVLLLVVSDANGKEIATGTGFLVSSDGKLITNHHVIEGAASAVAKAENGGLFPVEGVLASDPKNDVVLLKIKGKELPFLTLGKSEKIEVGTRVAVIGSPLGLEGTLSEGIVSAVRELMGDIRKLQITAAISPGSSGSPVMDAKGDVVGIAAALLHGGQSLNLAVPAECAHQLLAKAKPSAVPQSFVKSVSSGDDAIYSDLDWRAAQAADASKDYIEQLKRSKAIVKRYPESPIGFFCLGNALDNLSFNEDAIIAFREAIKIKPDYASAWNNLGITYGKCRRWDDAVSAIQQAIKLNQEEPVSWGALGSVYQLAGNYAHSIAAFRNAIKLKPDYADAWHDLGEVYGQSGRTDEAIAAYQQAIKIKADYAEAWWNLAVAYTKSGRTNEAIEAFAKHRKLKPELFN